MADRYDVTVVGGGPGGYVAAIRGAQLGRRVALVERGELGGVCLNEGCIPTKSLLASAEVLELARRSSEFGVKVGSAEPDVPAMFDRKDAVVARLRGGVESLLQKRGVDVFRGDGELLEPGAVRVVGPDGERTVSSDAVILATGSTPIIPQGFPFDGARVITSREALELRQLPSTMIIIGTGAVGCEFAGLFSSLGVSVTLVEMLPDILPGEDASAVRLLKSAFKRRGVTIRTNARVDALEIAGDAVRATLSGGEVVVAETALLAIGRRPSIDAAWIGNCGIDTVGGAIRVNERMETSVDGIYAIGDLVGGWLLAHVASHEGIVAATAAAGRDARMDYRAVPRCTFTKPEIASVGITEADAADRGIQLDIGRFPFAASGKALAGGDTSGFVKILAEVGSGVVLGGVIAGPHASDLIHEIGLAVTARLTVDDIAAVIHAHPTLGEAVMEAAEAVHGLGVHTL